MNLSREQSGLKTMTLIDSAYTFEEINAAKAALSCHLQAFPEDKIRDLGHILPYLEESAQAREAEARHLRLSATDAHDRDQLLKHCAAFRDPLTENASSEVESLQADLLRWLAVHHNDMAARAVLRTLQNERDFIALLQAEDQTAPEPLIKSQANKQNRQEPIGSKV